MRTEIEKLLQWGIICSCSERSPPRQNLHHWISVSRYTAEDANCFYHCWWMKADWPWYEKILLVMLLQTTCWHLFFAHFCIGCRVKRSESCHRSNGCTMVVHISIYEIWLSVGIMHRSVGVFAGWGGGRRRRSEMSSHMSSRRRSSKQHNELLEIKSLHALCKTMMTLSAKVVSRSPQTRYPTQRHSVTETIAPMPLAQDPSTSSLAAFSTGVAWWAWSLSGWDSGDTE